VFIYKRFSRIQRFKIIAQEFYIFKREEILSHANEKSWFGKRGEKGEFHPLIFFNWVIEFDRRHSEEFWERVGWSVKNNFGPINSIFDNLNLSLQHSRKQLFG
jgi:hypothetical protein